jgi:hypothetical protein
LVAACSQNSGPAAPTVANPTASGVVCNELLPNDAGPHDGATNCRRRFDGCSDGLSYELKCADGTCSCVADGDELGKYRVTESACDVDIGEMKVLCGWNLPNGGERIRVPERR